MSEPDLEAFFRASVDLLCIARLDGQIIRVNPGWEAALGRQAAELEGRSLVELAASEARPIIDEMLARLSSGGAVRGLDLPCTDADGSRIWLRWSASVDPLQPMHFAAVARDVTAEHAQRAATASRLAQLEDRAEQLGMISDMGELLQSSRGMDDAREVIDLFLRKIFPAHSGGVYVLDESRGHGELISSFGQMQVQQVIDPTDCWALRRGRPHWSTGEWLALDCGHARIRNLAHVCLPLMAQGAAKGLLHLELPHDHDVARDSAEARFVNAVADHLGLAIANVTLRERLQRQTIRDPLTGCFNRRYLEETLVRELRRAEREDRPLSLVMMDLDHFKSFNDTHGHVAADELLVELGKLLREFFRTEDVVCRFGGEEFVILLPGATPEQALGRMEEIRGMVKQLRAGRRVGREVTFSAGISSAAEAQARDGSDLIRTADATMYLAKTDGRDRIYLSRPSPARPSVASRKAS